MVTKNWKIEIKRKIIIDFEKYRRQKFNTCNKQSIEKVIDDYLKSINDE